MPESKKHAWDIYARKLWSLGHGHALWIPEGETFIGDIGYITDGRFMPLFNAMKDLDEQRKDEDGDARVPDGFTPFTKKNLTYDNRPEHIPARLLFSQSMQAIDATAGAATGPLVSGVVDAVARTSFRSNRQSGAILSLQSSAHSIELVNKRHVVNYVRENFENWIDYANGNDTLGLDIRLSQLLFVSGTTKTSSWGVAAFSSCNRGAEIRVTADVLRLASSNFSVAITQETSPSVEYRSGPSPTIVQQQHPEVESGTLAQDSETASRNQRNQTVFIHYYKTVHRLFWTTTMRAAAGYHDLPGPEDDNSNTGQELQSDKAAPEIPAFDPVSALLYYIFEHSDATVAVASTRDLIYLCEEDDDVWDDVSTLLRRVQPRIDVDEHGVGTILTSHRTSGSTEGSTELTAESYEQGHLGTQQPQIQAHQTHILPDSPKLRPAHETIEYAESVTSQVLSPDGGLAAFVSGDTLVVLWDLQDRSRRWSLRHHNDTVWCIVFSPDGKRLVSGGGDGDLVIWGLEPVRTLAIIQSHKNSITAVAYSPNGTAIASAGSDGEILLWDATTLTLLRALPDPDKTIKSLRFSPNGLWLASSGSHKVKIWNADAGTSQAVLGGHSGMVSCLDFSPDGRRVLTASDDGSARIWMTETGETLVVVGEHTGAIWVARFSPDGARVLTASSDSTARVSDSFTGKQILLLDGHESMVNSAVFSRDGERIATGSVDSKVKIWDAAEGKCLETFSDGTDGVVLVAFSHDRGSLVSWYGDGHVQECDLCAVGV